MEENETQESQQLEPSIPNDLSSTTATMHYSSETGVSSQAGGGTCKTCNPNGKSFGNQSPNFVYAIGTIEPRFPMLSLEKECMQATSRLKDTKGLTDQEALLKVISEPHNRYLARQMCWVFKVEGLETYILQARDFIDLEQLIAAVRPNPNNNDVDVVIGYRGNIAPPDACNGLALPMVLIEQVYSFDIDSLMKAMVRPEGMTAKEFEPKAQALYNQIIHMADNAGTTDEHRALNYLAVRCDAVYRVCAEEFGNDCSLTDVHVRPSRLTGARKIADAIFTFTHRKTGILNKWFVRVDVTEEFPFLVSPLSPYYVYDQNQ